jgi:hypothetical protein
MYGLNMSRDIQTTIEKTPRKYAALRSTRGRFDAHYKQSDTAALPFYNSYTGMADAIAKSPRKLSSLRSKVERFPKHGFMQKFFDKSKIVTQDKIYNTEALNQASMTTQVQTSPRRYSTLRSKRSRFGRKLADVPYGPIDDPGMLGPGSYQKAEEVSTSSGRYMSTVGAVLMSPRHYSSFKSRTPRFRGGAFGASGSGSGSMWPPMQARARR